MTHQTSWLESTVVCGVEKKPSWWEFYSKKNLRSCYCLLTLAKDKHDPPGVAAGAGARSFNLPSSKALNRLAAMLLMVFWGSLGLATRPGVATCGEEASLLAAAPCNSTQYKVVTAVTL